MRLEYGLDRSGGDQVIYRAADGVERFHELNGRAVDLGQLSAPRGLVELLEVGFVGVGQDALAAIIHNREGTVRAEYLTGPLSLADVGEKVPQAKAMADFMGERVDLIPVALRK
jgi:hypothetical protein